MGHRQGNPPRIFAETRLTASAGIAPNKMLAKIASDWRKPNGQFAITPDQIDAFIRDLPVRKIWGVGPKSAAKFEQQGIRTCGDLQKITLPELAQRHGKWGHELYQLCRGQDDRPVEPNRTRKSLSNECTYPDNLTTLEQCQRELDQLVDELLHELRAKAPDRAIHKAFVKVKFADFTPHDQGMRERPADPRDLPGPARGSVPAEPAAHPPARHRRPLR